MLVSNLLVDILLFGALLLGVIVDGMVPSAHGAVSLFAVGAVLYLAAQEAAHALEKRGQWTQESLWTSISLCAAGLVYYWWRNQSDLALLGLSLGLMMASLMIAIGVIGAIGAATHGQIKALGGLIITLLGALFLGVLAGALVLALSQPNEILPLAWKIGVVILSALGWKLREKSIAATSNATAVEEMPAAPIVETPTATTAPGVEVPAFVQNIPGVKNASSHHAAEAQNAHHAAHRTLIPQRGTILDRFWPALVLGALLLFFAANGSKLVAPISAPAIAGTPLP